jgi:hypothetical protein
MAPAIQLLLLLFLRRRRRRCCGARVRYRHRHRCRHGYGYGYGSWSVLLVSRLGFCAAVGKRNGGIGTIYEDDWGGGESYLALVVL